MQVTSVSQIKLDVSSERKEHYLNMLEDEEYIKDGKITLKGLEYLVYNPVMEQQQLSAKGIKVLIWTEEQTYERHKVQRMRSHYRKGNRTDKRWKYFHYVSQPQSKRRTVQDREYNK